MCDTWQAICVTHGMPCVNMHGTFGHYIKAFIHGVSRISPWEQQGEGKEKGRKRKGKERRKEKKKGEEERKKKEEKEGVLRSQQTRTAKNPELRYKR